MTTPARQQYLRIKEEHPGSILMFRMGDFYETFDDDARIVSRELEIALTSREMGKGQRIPLAGIPYHSLEPYLTKLIKKGHKVALCEQTSDPASSKGLVDREVVRVVTPGTVLEDSLLDQNVNNYLSAIIVIDDQVGFSYVDITTSEFATTQFHLSDLNAELSRLVPSEILIPKGYDGLLVNHSATATHLELESFDLGFTTDLLLNHFGVTSLEGFGCQHLPLAIRAAGSIVDYLGTNQKSAVGQLNSLYTYSNSSYMALDTQTRRNLELFEAGRWGNDGISLYNVLNSTNTSMGGRLLRNWLSRPLLEIEKINQRLSAVTWFNNSSLRRSRIVELLRNISDIERLLNKIRNYVAQPQDLLALAKSLENAPKIRDILRQDQDVSLVESFASRISDNQETLDLIQGAIEDEPSVSVGEGKVIRYGYSEDLDELRDSTRGARDYIAGLESKEKQRTGIKSLKVGYNKVFGYYIEVSNSNLEYVPEEYIRRQTLVGGERFITPEMKEHESLILNAQERIEELETSLFREICVKVGEYSVTIKSTAEAIAKVDVFCSFGEVASRNGYTKPELNDGDVLGIKQGRHPMVEHTMPSGSFVPNDIVMSNSHDQLIILTGPNMAGKSTFIRQVGLITLMAQVGSFVPAESATIGVVDRIFTRVGLQDDLSMGQSTFMVEMLETAFILHHAMPRSLVILDEIGRGTSTYDGLAIAKAVAEHIHENSNLGCKTLFATHYHELTELSNELSRVKNYNVAVSENQGQVVFLRRILPGGADKSYGIHVARLAGLPSSVVTRATEILKDLEDGSSQPQPMAKKKSFPSNESGKENIKISKQLPLMVAEYDVVKKLLELSVDSMTPIEAIKHLHELQEQARMNNE